MFSVRNFLKIIISEFEKDYRESWLSKGYLPFRGWGGNNLGGNVTCYNSMGFRIAKLHERRHILSLLERRFLVSPSRERDES